MTIGVEVTEFKKREAKRQRRLLKKEVAGKKR